MSPQDKADPRAVGGYYYKDDSLQGFQFTNTSRTRRTFDSKDGVRSKSIFGMIEADIGEKISRSAPKRVTRRKRSSDRPRCSRTMQAPTTRFRLAATGIRRAKFNAFLPRFTVRLGSRAKR